MNHISHMPRVATFSGIVIAMYPADHNPPHVHAYVAEHAVLLVIATGDVLEGSLPGRQLRLAQAWVHENREALSARWAELNP